MKQISDRPMLKSYESDGTPTYCVEAIVPVSAGVSIPEMRLYNRGSSELQALVGKVPDIGTVTTNFPDADVLVTGSEKDKEGRQTVHIRVTSKANLRELVQPLKVS